MANCKECRYVLYAQSGNPVCCYYGPQECEPHGDCEQFEPPDEKPQDTADDFEEALSKITKQGIILLSALLSLIPAGLTLALLRFAGLPWEIVWPGAALAFGACIALMAAVATGSERGRR